MEKQKLMLIAGCSHVAGSEIDGTDDSEYNRKHSFGNLLSNKLGYVPVNIAIPGSSNSGIARSILKWFEINYDPEVMEVVVLIAWTSSTRLELPVDNEKPLPKDICSSWIDVTGKGFYRVILGYDGNINQPEEVDMTKKAHRFIADNEKFFEIASINYILQLQYFLQSRKVNYVMCNSMPIYYNYSKHLGYYLSLVDSTKYYRVHDASEAFYPKYKELGYTNLKAKYWHHGEEPHYIFAEELYNYIEENKCL